MKWLTQEEKIEVPIFSIVTTRKREGRWEYYESDSGAGDWAELVYILFEDYGQFRKEVETGHKYQVLDNIADKLARQGQPYEFKLPDGTDNWYYAFCKTATFSLDYEGKLT